MAKVDLYICDRCKREGKSGFTNRVYFTYGRSYDGVESSNDDAVADLCVTCAGNCLNEIVKQMGHDETKKYIQSNQKWLKFA